MKKLTLRLFALFFPLALACGASEDADPAQPEVTVITHPEAQFDELSGWSAPPDPIIVHPGDPVLQFDAEGPWGLHETGGDIGQGAEALSIPSGYGLGAPCSNVFDAPCLIGKDKEVRPRWGGGRTTDPATPGVDWQVEMRHAISRLQQQRTNWTIVEGGSTSRDFVGGFAPFQTTDGFDLGDTRPDLVAATSCANGICSRKFNGCLIDLAPAQLGRTDFPYCGTQANCQFFAETVIEHEVTHCIGMSHSTVAVGTPGSYMRSSLSTTVDTNMNQAQKDALNGYQP